MRLALAVGMVLLASCSLGGGSRDGETGIPDIPSLPDNGTETTPFEEAPETSVTDSGTFDPGPQPSPVVDPNCIDGRCTEPLPLPGADLSGPIASFDKNAWQAFVDSALATRYPVGGYIVTQALQKGAIKNCTAQFLDDKNSAKAILLGLSTAVHECGHSLDMGLGGYGEAAFVMTPDVRFTCKGGANQGNGGKTFSRSLIRDDAYSQALPPCAAFGTGGHCDDYAAIYLDGDPTDGKFDSGDQGYDSVLDEVTQYINSLATGYAFEDQYPYMVSERDGILTFLWYLERYLHLARTAHPEVYALLADDACWRGVTLSLWGRAWLFLGLTEKSGKLGINDGELEDLVLEPDLVAEIEALRAKEGCD